MNESRTRQTASRWLLRLGMVLFFVALLTGLLIPGLKNPRMGSSSHVVGLIGGTFLVVVGFLQPKLRLSPAPTIVVFWLAVYGAYVGWATRLAAAVWGAGGSMFPVTGNGLRGTPLQEGLVTFGALSLVPVLLIMSLMILWGLRGAETPQGQGT